MLLRSSRPCCITAGKMMPLNFQTYCTVSMSLGFGLQNIRVRFILCAFMGFRWCKRPCRTLPWFCRRRREDGWRFFSKSELYIFVMCIYKAINIFRYNDPPWFLPLLCIFMRDLGKTNDFMKKMSSYFKAFILLPNKDVWSRIKSSWDTHGQSVWNVKMKLCLCFSGPSIRAGGLFRCITVKNY